MKVIENKNVKEKLYIEKLENGLTVMIIPRKNVRKKYIIYGTHFGSIDNTFMLPEKTEAERVPDGIAHFLEHKMFEQKSGVNSLDALTAMGVNANAYTCNDHTAYLYSGTDNFEEALDEFMDYVQNPYYTDENVEKEKGIISQEIKMYDNQPDWQAYLNAIKCMYKNLAINIDIAGTVEEINKITKEDLYLCYDNFYAPANMAIAVCGDFEPEKMLEEIKKRMVNKEYKEIPKRIYPEEPEEVAQKEKRIKMDITNPIFVLGYKDKPKGDMVKRHIAIQIALGTLFGKSSKLNQELTDKNLILNTLDPEYDYSNNYAFALIIGMSRNPDEVIAKIKQELENAKKNGLNKEDFERNKKKLYGDYITEFNDVEETAKNFMVDYFKGVNTFEYLEKYEEVTKEYTEEILRELFVEEKSVTSIVE
ncbi:MAG: insulinase family protein [Clostridia bacterium]|nr:insulinase family protein [Clostridia bacterium]